MRKSLLLLTATFLISLASVNAQTKNMVDSSAATQSKEIPKEKKVLDTNESLKYMGSKLWFQMKKRLNLTTKEEEEAEIKKREQVTLSIGSLKIEG